MEISPELTTILTAMTPIGELRVALPIALLSYKISIVPAYILSVIGNMIPVFLLLIFWKYFAKFLMIFKIFNFEHSENISHLRWTIDYEEDLEFVRRILEKLGSSDLFSMADVIKVLRENPEIAKKQKKVIRNEGYQKSIDEEKK